MEYRVKHLLLLFCVLKIRVVFLNNGPNAYTICLYSIDKPHFRWSQLVEWENVLRIGVLYWPSVGKYPVDKIIQDKYQVNSVNFFFATFIII